MVTAVICSKPRAESSWLMLDKVKRLTRTDAAPEVLAATEKSTTTLEARRRRREPVFSTTELILTLSTVTLLAAATPSLNVSLLLSNDAFV